MRGVRRQTLRGFVWRLSEQHPDAASTLVQRELNPYPPGHEPRQALKRSRLSIALLEHSLGLREGLRQRKTHAALAI